MFMHVYVSCNGCSAKVSDWDDEIDDWVILRRGTNVYRYCPVCIPDSVKSLTESVASQDVVQGVVQDPKKEYHPLQKEFGFNAPEDGAMGRYDEDILRRGAAIHLDGAKAVVPWIQYRFWWFLHNCVAHVAIGLVPVRATFRFHDYTSRRMHGTK